MKCGLLKTSKSLSICSLLLLLVLFGLFGVNLKKVDASIVYETISSYLNVASTTGSGTGDPLKALGKADNIVWNGFPTATTTFYWNFNKNIPTGAIIDSVMISTRAYNQFPGSANNKLIIQSATTSPMTLSSTWASSTSLITEYFNFDATTNNPTYWNSFNQISYYNSNYILSGTGQTPTGTYYSGNISSSLVSGLSFKYNIANGVYLDSASIQVYYHYDNTIPASAIKTFTISPIDSSTYPNMILASSTITTTYSNSNADYTNIQYKMYDNFTNTTKIIYVPVSISTTLSTSTLTNFCSASNFNCNNGDTYQLSARFSNSDGSILSSYFPTYYYLAYIAYIPTPTATTSVIIIGTGFDTGTTTIDVNTMYTDCGLTNLGGCFQNALVWAFVPSSGAISNYYTFTSSMNTKAPMGYFQVVKNNLNNLNSTSSPAFVVVIPEHIKQYFFSPFDLGIAGILWFFFAINFYKRLKHITV